MTPKLRNLVEVEQSYTRHRFLDEAGDMTFYGKGRTPIIGVQAGVSLGFILGMVKFRSPLEPIRQEIRHLQVQTANDPYFNDVPSVQKKKAELGGYYFHATDDPQEARKFFTNTSNHWMLVSKLWLGGKSQIFTSVSTMAEKPNSMQICSRTCSRISCRLAGL